MPAQVLQVDEVPQDIWIQIYAPKRRHVIHIVCAELQRQAAAIADQPFQVVDESSPDALALLLAWFGVYLQCKPADEIKTYGYHRAGVLAALGAAVIWGGMYVVSKVVLEVISGRKSAAAVCRGSPALAACSG